MTGSIFKSDKHFPTFLPARALVRLPLRALSILSIAVGVATCSDTPPAAVKHSSLGPNGGVIASVEFDPVFSAAALEIAPRLGGFGIHYDHVRVVLVRPVADTVKDTTIAFTPTTPDVTLNLTVEVRYTGEMFEVGIDYLNTSGVVFHGHGPVRAHSGDQSKPPREQISIDYVGPGANVARIAVSPRAITLHTGETTTFVAAAFDANNNPVATVPLSWSTSDSSIATIGDTGLLQALGKRGSAAVIAVTPTGVTDHATVAIVPPPASVALVGGGGQSGIVGTALPAPAVVQVNAADGLAVPGVSVAFTPPPGGRVASVTATTDENGRASTGLTLGTVAGLQVFAASSGNVSTNVPVTALPGAPAAIAVVSGSDQADTVRRSVAPLVVRVTDQFGNPVPGVVVSWTQSSGTGSLGSATCTTAADGRATMTYTLGSVAGSESVAAWVNGVAGHAVFTLQAIAAAPSTIVALSGNGQTARVGTALTAPLVVAVADDAGNPVSGASVSWTATNGTITPTSSTDSRGRASATLTLGTHSGSASATAAIANGRHVTFGATAQPGIAAVAAFSTQPANGTAGATLSSVRVTLVDAYGNQTTSSNAVTIGLGNNPVGATLSGTLVRNASNGVATFDDLQIDKAGTGYTLAASSAGVASATSSSFNIAGVAHLTIVAGDDQHAAAGSPVPVAPSVKVIDAGGNPIAGVPVTFSPSDGGVVVPSTAITTDASGLATLTAWNLGTHAGPQTLVVSTPGVPSVVINAGAFAGPPAMLAVVTQPSATATSGVIIGRQPVIQLQDHFGNPTATSNLTVTVAVSSGSLLGTTGVVADPVTGLATFTDLKIVATGDVTLTFSAPGIQSVTSSSITVSIAAP
ncbi:MAG: Ig-like domain-containing protein [Gemmatimonas sp.]